MIKKGVSMNGLLLPASEPKLDRSVPRKPLLVFIHWQQISPPKPWKKLKVLFLEGIVLA